MLLCSRLWEIPCRMLLSAQPPCRRVGCGIGCQVHSTLCCERRTAFLFLYQLICCQAFFVIMRNVPPHNLVPTMPCWHPVDIA